MRKEKPLIALLRGLVDLLGEESERNPMFAAKVEALLSSLPDRTVQSTPKLVRSSILHLMSMQSWPTVARQNFDFGCETGRSPYCER